MQEGRPPSFSKHLALMHVGHCSGCRSQTLNSVSFHSEVSSGEEVALTGGRQVSLRVHLQSWGWEENWALSDS